MTSTGTIGDRPRFQSLPLSIGWLPLGEGAYLHLGNPDEEEPIITVVGVPDVSMAGMNVMLLG